MEKKFELGHLVATARVSNAIGADRKFQVFANKCLQRYVGKDWGDLDPDDWALNDESLESDGRILASYSLPEEFRIDGENKLWIITEWDRSVTTILFPGDY